jgi:F-type H+-transporting ATPase subunit b
MQSVTDAPHTGGEPVTTTTEQPAEHKGLPQFEFQTWPGQIVWAVLIFVVLYLALSRMLKKLRGAIDERGGVIAGSLADARAIRDEAEAQAKAAEAELAEGRARAQRTAVEAKAKAKAETAAREADEQKRLDAKLAEAEGKIRGARDQAMTNVHAIAAETSAALVAKLTGDQPGADEVEAALAETAA